MQLCYAPLLPKVQLDGLSHLFLWAAHSTTICDKRTPTNGSFACIFSGLAEVDEKEHHPPKHDVSIETSAQFQSGMPSTCSL